MRAAFKVTRSMSRVMRSVREMNREYAGAAEFVVAPDRRPPAEVITPPLEEEKPLVGEMKPTEQEKKPLNEEKKAVQEHKEAPAAQTDMEVTLQYMKTVAQWIDYVEQSMQKLEEQTDRLDRKIAELRTSQNPEDVCRRVLRPLAEWVQTWQDIARDQPENAGQIASNIDEAAGVIEKECRMYGVKRYRSRPGDPFDGERMEADENVVETDDPACSGKIIESLSDGWEMNGRTCFDERVRAYRYQEKPGQ